MSESELFIPNQILFSELSNDFNPIHLNGEYLIDTQFEKNLQYGANIILSACEYLVSSTQLLVEEINCEFIKPVYINSKVYINERDSMFTITADGLTVVRFQIKFSCISSNIDSSTVNTKQTIKGDNIESLSHKNLLDILGKENTFYYAIDHIKSNNLYPYLSKYNTSLIKDLCFISFLVGMKIPGEHSILSKIQLSCNSNTKQLATKKSIYKVILSKYRKEASYGTLQIKSQLSDIKVNFFLRPNIKNLDGNINKLIGKGLKLKAQEHEDISLLILGGSKGIGLDLSTYFASLGLDVSATYRRQIKYMLNRLNYLKEKDIQFKAIHYNTIGPEKINFFNYDVIIDCITPKIMRGTKKEISFDLFQDFCKSYLGNIISLSKLLCNSNRNHLIVVPSSSAVNEVPTGMVEYAGSKAALEVICKGIEKTYSNIKIICPRLKRVKTIQTLSIIDKGKTSVDASIELGDLIMKAIETNKDESKKYFKD